MAIKQRAASLPKQILLFCAFLLGVCSPRAEAQSLWDPLASDIARSTVLVELFTSQGCSSCPAADRVLARLLYEQPVENVKIIALGQHVDYWNYLGWRDIFSSSLFSKRQRGYAAYFGGGRVYTPQMIVDGSYEFVGHRHAQAIQLIGRAAQRAEEVKIKSCSLKSKTKRRISVLIQSKSSKNLERLSLYFAIAQKRLSTQIRSGENAGHNLHYSSVVRYLKNLSGSGMRLSPSQEGAFRHEVSLSPRWRKKHLMYAAFFQSQIDGRIIGSRECFLAN